MRRIVGFLVATTLAVALGVSLAPLVRPVFGALAVVAGGLAGMVALGLVLGVLRQGMVHVDAALLPVSQRVNARRMRWHAWMERHVRRHLPPWAFREGVVAFWLVGMPALALTLVTWYALIRYPAH